LLAWGSLQLLLSCHPPQLRPTHFVCHPSRSGGSALFYGLSSRGAAGGSALSSSVILSGGGLAAGVEGPLFPPGCSRPTLETRNFFTTHYPLTTISETAPACLPSPRACAPWPTRSLPTRSTCCAPTNSTHELVERRLFMFYCHHEGASAPEGSAFSIHYPLSTAL
jgi:hypothetical protein